MQSNIKLIATDFDGTVAGVTKVVSKANLEAMEYARSKGVHLAVLSGRAIPTLKKAINDFVKDDMLISACNGALIYKNDQILFKKNIDKENIETLLDISKDLDTFFTMNTLDSVHALNVQRALDMKDRWQRLLGSDFKMGYNFYDDHKGLLNSINDNVFSMVFFETDNDKRLKLYDKLIKVPGVSVTSSFESNIEVMGSYISKAYALKNICDILNIDIKDTMALGDNYNDMDMIKLAGIGVAMGNADQMIKQSADFVTKTCDEDGFAYAVHKFI